MLTTPLLRWAHGGYVISTDRAQLDLELMHDYLTHSYWSPGVPRHVVAKAVQNSFCFGLYSGSAQIGFARVVTDFATYAYLADVFVLPAHQDRGLGTWLIGTIVQCPALDGIRTFFLATRDAHGLYEKFGFSRVEDGGRLMAASYAMPWRRPDLIDPALQTEREQT